MGQANNTNYLNRIISVTSFKQFIAYYDYASPLARSCERLFELGQESCYVCNVQGVEDYLEVIDQVRSLTVDYILLPNLFFDEKIILKDGRELPVYLVLSELLPSNAFIITDYHARDFVNMSHFLKHYNTIRHKLSYLARYPENISFVANHLSESDHASIDVACALLSAPVGDAPQLTLGQSYFALEREDFFSPVIYFKNELAENLFNLGSGLESNLIIQIMCQTVQKELNQLFDYLIGTHFTKNTLFTVRYKAEDYLTYRQGHYYKNYRIVDIIIKNKKIYLDIDLYPYLPIQSVRTQVTLKGV